MSREAAPCGAPRSYGDRPGGCQAEHHKPVCLRCRWRPVTVARLNRGWRAHAGSVLLIDTLIDIYIWLLIAQAILSWLLAFGVVNRHNRAVATLGDFLYRVTEPALRPIRNFL